MSAGPNVEPDRLVRVLPTWLPDAAIVAHPIRWWASQIEALHRVAPCVLT
jgi:hypothetical protein